jgi:transcriptional regulator with XRE-family HTH domain
MCQVPKDNYNWHIGTWFIKMANIREILAQNLKENRRKLGITQPELAERADLSIHHIAMIEIGRRFPSADVIDRLAVALDIEPNELFAVAVPTEKAIEQMQQAILNNLNQGLERAMDKLDKAIKKRCGQQCKVKDKSLKK